MKQGRGQGNVMSWKGWLLLLGIIVVAGLASHLWLKNVIDDKNDERNELDARRVQEQGELEKKQQQLDEINSPDYIVKIAYENYDMINREEIHFEFDHPENLRNYTPEELAIWMEDIRE